MIFLIHYDRSAGALIELREFTETERGIASAAKLEIEIRLLSGPTGQEVVLLEAPDEQSLRKTHRRYFDSFDEMKSSQSVQQSESRALKYWYLIPVGTSWKVRSEGQSEAIYPDKERAMAAAALDAKEWNHTTGKPTGVRISTKDGGWVEEVTFESE